MLVLQQNSPKATKLIVIDNRVYKASSISRFYSQVNGCLPLIVLFS